MCHSRKKRRKFSTLENKRNLIIIYYSFRSIKQQYHVGKIYLINIEGRVVGMNVVGVKWGVNVKTNKTNANTNNMFYINMKLS